MQTPDFVQFIDQWLPRIGWSTVVAFVLFLLRLGWKANALFNMVSAEWRGVKEDVQNTKKMVTELTTNHLAHMEEHSAAQVQLLSDIKESLTKLNENIAFLKGKLSK